MPILNRWLRHIKVVILKKSGNLPIKKQATITTFDELIKNDYRSRLGEMEKLINAYIDVGANDKWLVRALLELIETDETILETDKFHICQNGQIKEKAKIRNMTDFSLPSFLLGIWHFVILYRKDNSVGKGTYDKWCLPGESPNTRMPFESDIGSTITRKLILLPHMNATETPHLDSDVFENAENTGTEQDEQCVDDFDNKATTSQVLNNGFLFQQFGNNNKQIVGNVGTLIINND
jgi:hypothetical protein